MRKLMSAMLLALAALVAPSAATAQNVRCGPDDVGHYRCGAILVILIEDTADTIEEVIGRMGGDPATDLMQEFLSPNFQRRSGPF